MPFPLAPVTSYVATLEAAWDAHTAPRAPDAPTVVSLFAGCGGSSLGYSMAGYRELLAVERDDNAVDTFRLNFPGVPVYQGDICGLTVEQALTFAGVRAGELDVLDGSPPCQGFSTAGRRNLDDPRNGLFREYVRLLRGLRPKAFVMENVSGLVKGKMKLVFAEILRELRALGYHVKAKLLNAMYYGVPQSRQRLIFIGVRDDLEIEPSHPKAASRPTRLVSSPETRTDAQRIPARRAENAVRHKDRHKAKGHGFGFVALKDGKPAPAWSKSTCFSTSAPRFIEQGIHWLPSPVELNRIGSFPPMFKFVGSYNDQWARIGNSVPPLFMRAIAIHVISEVLDKISSTEVYTRNVQP